MRVEGAKTSNDIRVCITLDTKLAFDSSTQNITFDSPSAKEDLERAKLLKRAEIISRIEKDALNGEKLRVKYYFSPSTITATVKSYQIERIRAVSGVTKVEKVEQHELIRPVTPRSETK